MRQLQRPPQALRFSRGRGERENRVTGDEPQGTTGRVQTAVEAPSRLTSRPLSPSRLPLRAHQRETSGYEAASASLRQSSYFLVASKTGPVDVMVRILAFSNAI